MVCEFGLEPDVCFAAVVEMFAEGVNTLFISCVILEFGAFEFSEPVLWIFFASIRAFEEFDVWHVVVVVWGRRRGWRGGWYDSDGGEVSRLLE